jgi:3'(2'), 5'-bisphosphate nucleotidase
MDNISLALDSLLSTAYKAGHAILDIYKREDLGVEIKGDNSPLTLADKAAHTIIESYLSQTSYPILSEEGVDIAYTTRKYWGTFWMVDPLDGTKEFISKNGEFTVNIALIHNESPIFGLVYAPLLDKLYYGGTLLGYSKLKTGDDVTSLDKQNCKTLADFDSKECQRIVASRSHQNQATVDFLAKFDKAEVTSMGSSLKFMLLAENEAELYPRFAPTMEWDTAAADGVLRALGKHIYKVSTDRIVSNDWLEYNKENLLNPFFISF